MFIGSADVPYEYQMLIMCRDVYHCTPNEFADIPADLVDLHMRFMAIEAEVREFNSK